MEPTWGSRRYYAEYRSEDHMPFNPSGGTPERGQQALSPHAPWVAGLPDILLMVLASLSLWALIVWALARYL